MMEISDMEMSLMLVSLRLSSQNQSLTQAFSFPNKMTNKEVSGDNDKYIEMTGSRGLTPIHYPLYSGAKLIDKERLSPSVK